MRWIVCSLLLILTTPIYANRSCEGALVKRPQSAVDLSALKDHRLFRLAEALDMGEGYTFYIDPIGPVSGEMGEGIQGEFLRDLIREIFPRARVRSVVQAPQNRILARTFMFSLVDNAESGISRRAHAFRDETIEMSDIKPAHISWMLGRRNRIREKLSMPRERRVAHIYLRNPFTLAQHIDAVQGRSDLSAILRKMKGLGFDDVIVSATEFYDDFFLTLKEMRQELPILHHLFPKILPVSDLLKRGVTETSQPVLYINDVRGYMPTLHALANFTLTVGPINFFESIFTGTETVALLNKKVSGGYDSAVLYKIVSYAKDYPNFKTVRSLDAIKVDGQVLKDIPANSDRALSDFLQILHFKISNQLRRPRAS